MEPTPIVPCDHVAAARGSVGPLARLTMDSFVLTNTSIYRAIAEEAHASMSELMAAGRRRRTDDGWIVTYDPTHASVKQACIAIVFAGIWLEAAAHLAIVRQDGVEKAKEYDRRFYEDKLRLLGWSEEKPCSRAQGASKSPGESWFTRRPI